MSFIRFIYNIVSRRTVLAVSALFSLTFIAPAYAEEPATGIMGGGFGMILPLILIFVIMYFMIIRPQRKQIANHKAMVDAVRRGDAVVTAGGIVGKVSRVFDDSGEIEVEVAENVKVRVIRSTLSAVRTKGVSAETGAKAPNTEKDKQDSEKAEK